MNIVVKSDVIWIRPIPTKDIKDGIKLYIPKLETEQNTGIIMVDIKAGQGDYQLPPEVTADDIADIRYSSSTLLIDFK